MDKFSLDGFQIVHFDNKSILQERRVILGMTQKQVAEKAKIPLQSYQRFESGDRNIKTASFQVACRVLEALELNIADFFHGEYVLGERFLDSKEGLRYEKTGKLINEDVVEDAPSDK
ncbi:MAG: XRE family transcriptional regulator [Proteobacteria bacterium]|nr:XRE family transcriptional regulator [Pseudomonadota bacterium]